MLRLANNSTYYGEHFGASKSVSGELVFQTGMVGYIEAMTDPSYAGQILVFTYPMIGNYSVDEERMMESRKVWVKGIVVRDVHLEEGFEQFMKKWDVPGLVGVDTRSLVTKLREEGTILAQMLNNIDEEFTKWYDPAKVNLVKEVSIDSIQDINVYENTKTILVIDCGIKNSQIECLIKESSNADGYKIKRVPYDYDYVETGEHFDGIFISNGPGDPKMASATIDVLHKQLERAECDDKWLVPIFGICLGHQLLALAAGFSTKRLKYGNRAQNIPVRLMNTKCGYITTQNHGYAVDLGEDSDERNEVEEERKGVSGLGGMWKPLFTNLNDGTNEGIFCEDKPYFSVQFHPEGRAGPTDTNWLFNIFAKMVGYGKQLTECGYKYGIQSMIHDLIRVDEVDNKNEVANFKKVLVLGSGGLTIGQAGEFDYSGSQALKAYNECGMYTVLINPNIATVQTTTGLDLADKVYSLPVTPEYVEKIIQEELPDCIAISFGGQTALNCACILNERGVFKRYGITVLGTEISTIELSEDRGAFKDRVEKIGYECAPSKIVHNVEEGVAVAKSIGYPVLVRNGFALGGLGSGFAHNEKEMIELMEGSLAVGDNVIIDKSLFGWKELEYEIVRDKYGNTVTVCNMENFDPVGVHTGESIVVAPSQTIDDKQYFMLRQCAIDVANSLKIVGECNIQFALDPNSDQFYVIELNARLSRSSALASKATGYPLAYVAAKLSMSYSLLDLKNCITQDTVALYEPSLDYCAVKFPRWDLNKFDKVDTTIGTCMKSVGEVMAIGATFEEALMKAIRMVGLKLDLNELSYTDIQDSWDSMCDLSIITPERIISIFKALESRSVKEIWNETSITNWFLDRIKRVTDYFKHVKNTEILSSTLLHQGKRLGCSDQQIAKLVGSTEIEIRKMREQWNIHPVVKRIDTVAAEFPCNTNYLYLTYGGDVSDEVSEDKVKNKWVLVLGSGVYRVGNSVEFDWCSVNCIKSCQEAGYNVAMLNYNPETVSTDYDITEKLYFDEIELETVLELWRLETGLIGVIVSVGGQQPNNIAKELDTYGVKILGTSADMIDSAENRYKFSRLLDHNGVDQPVWRELTDQESAIDFCAEVGYPCLVRPSYVLSGAAMNVAFSDDDLIKYLGDAVHLSKDYPVVISKFIIDAKEIEVDAVSRGGEVVLMAISEHIENAGVHSGDATLVLPAQDLTKKTVAQIEASVHKIAGALEINGPFNIQFIAKDDKIKVIECNLRSSRSFPFVSKVLGVNFIQIATNVMLGLEDIGSTEIRGVKERIGVKVPQFSFHRLSGADCVLGVEMMSTGEIACFGRTKEEAYLKGLQAVGYKLPKEGSTVLVSIGSYRYKREMLNSVKRLSEKYTLIATAGTADFYKEHGVIIEPISWKIIHNMIKSGKIGFVINVSMLDRKMVTKDKSRGYYLRRCAIENGVGLLTDVKNARLFIDALLRRRKAVVKSAIDCMNSHRIIKLPGLIDPHVHIREPGDVHKGDWDSETAAAIAGGVTTVFVMPNTKPPITNLKNLNLIRSCADTKGRCRYGIILGATMDNHDDLEEIMEKSPEGVIGLKMYLDETYTKSDLQFTDWTMVEKHFACWRWRHPIIVHTEYDNLLKIIGLMAIYRRNVHVAHAHNRDVLEVIKRAKQMGLPITCEVTPHHLLLNSSCCSRGVKPPLSDVEEKLEDYMEWIDCFATDHAPHLPEEKGCPGYPGLETCLALMLRYGVDTVREKMHDNVMKIFGVNQEDKGTWIEVDLDQNWIVPKSLAWSRSKWTPYTGMELKGMVRRVFRHGELAYIDGKVYSPVGSSDMVEVNWERENNNGEAYVKACLTASASTSLPRDPALPGSIGERVVDISTFEGEDLVESVKLEIQKRGGVNPSFGSHKMILTSTQFTRNDLRALYQEASRLRRAVKRGEKFTVLNGKSVGMLFYEPSTRTHGSFVAGVQRLGGNVLEVQENSSSIVKGETLEDTIRCLEQYVDCIVLRGRDGYCNRAAKVSKVPIINAGDGVGEHPTQALLDLFTIREERGTINGVTVTIVGDLKHGRTVHSLVKLLCLYNVRLRYVSSEELRMPEQIMKYVSERGIEQSEHTELNDVIEKTDVLYVTRVQQERFTDRDEYEKLKSKYLITPQTLSRAKKNLVVMHPLPRNGEIAVDVDSDPRAAYFRQMEYGLYLRMALLKLLFYKEE